MGCNPFQVSSATMLIRAPGTRVRRDIPYRAGAELESDGADQAAGEVSVTLANSASTPYPFPYEQQA